MLDSVSSLGKPVSVRELVRGLELEGDARRELKTVLRRLIDAGALVKIRGARVGLPDRMNLVVGRLSCSPAGHGFVDSREAAARARATSSWPPRTSARRSTATASWRASSVTGRRGPEGRIIRVLERANQRIVGRYESDGRFGGRVVPFDRRVLHEVFVAGGRRGRRRARDDGRGRDHAPADRHAQPGGPRDRRCSGCSATPASTSKVIVAKYALPDALPAARSRRRPSAWRAP